MNTATTQKKQIPVSAVFYPIMAGIAAGMAFMMLLTAGSMLASASPETSILFVTPVVSALSALFYVVPAALFAWMLSHWTEEDFGIVVGSMLMVPMVLAGLTLLFVPFLALTAMILGCPLIQLAVCGVALYRNFRWHRGLAPDLRQYPDGFYIRPFFTYFLPVIGVGLVANLLQSTSYFTAGKGPICDIEALLALWLFLSLSHLLLIEWVRRRCERMASVARAVWVPVALFGLAYVYFIGYDIFHAATLRAHPEMMMKYEIEGMLPISRNVALCRDTLQTQLLCYTYYATILLAYVASVVCLYKAAKK